MSWRVLLLILALVSAELIISAVVSNPNWIMSQINQERESIIHWVGYDNTRKIINKADTWYVALFQDSGVESSTNAFFIPEQSGFEDVADIDEKGQYIISILQEQLFVIWGQCYYALQRLSLLMEWFPYILLLLVPAVIDGAMTREIKKISYGFTSELRYVFGYKILITLLIIPFVYLFSPIAISTLAIPIWTVTLAVAALLMSSNLQKWI